MRILKQGVISRITDSFFSYQAWPSACVDADGVLSVVCSGFRMGHMCPFGKIVLYQSRDGGETFGFPMVAGDHYLDDRDPGVLALDGGKLLITRCSHPAAAYETAFAEWIYADSGEAGAGMLRQFAAIPEAERTGGCFYRIVSRDGTEIGPEQRIPVHAPHGPIRLRDGTIFYLGKVLFHPDPAQANRFSAYVSRDGGETFAFRGDCPIPAGYDLSQLHEAHCAELPDGRLMALFRAHLTENDLYFTMLRAFSADGGLHWSAWEETGICGSPPHLCPTADGRLALTYGRRVPPYGIYARAVSAAGEIAQEEWLLAPCGDDDIGYPATVQLPDGTLFTAYYAKYGSDPNTSLLSVRWALD